jgi:hypothetical protein
MPFFASLHIKTPARQAEWEISYPGYKRVAVEYNEKFGQKSLEINFPEIQETIENAQFNYIAIGYNEFGDGSVVRSIVCAPPIKIIKGYKPKVIVTNIPEPLPANLDPTAATIWHLINEQKMKPEDMPPALFELVNEAFAKVGMPIMQITREGTAKMEVKISQMKSFNLNGEK